MGGSADKAMKKLRRSVVGSYIKKDIRFGVKELRQVLTADVTATALNSDVHVHERGALYEYMRDMARLHDTSEGSLAQLASKAPTKIKPLSLFKKDWKIRKTKAGGSKQKYKNGNQERVRKANESQ